MVATKNDARERAPGDGSGSGEATLALGTKGSSGPEKREEEEKKGQLRKKSSITLRQKPFVWYEQKKLFDNVDAQGGLRRGKK